MFQSNTKSGINIEYLMHLITEYSQDAEDRRQNEPEHTSELQHIKICRHRANVHESKLTVCIILPSLSLSSFYLSLSIK
jgi:hypothetical protein